MSVIDSERWAVKVVRRLGLTLRERGSLNNGTCPDILELEDGRFAVIGTDATEELQATLPADAGCADYERIVVITRETLVAARKDIPRRVSMSRGRGSLGLLGVAQLGWAGPLRLLR